MLEFTLHTKPEYVVNWHHAKYCDILDQFISGDIKRLIISMPPQHGKSELSTRRMPAKLLGDNPSLKIAIAAYNHTFASKFNRDIQRIIDTEEYNYIYPDTCLNASNIRSSAKGAWLRNSDEFEIVDNVGSLKSVGIRVPP